MIAPLMPYDAFLREKVNFDRSFGFDVDEAEVNPILLSHQRAIVAWAVAGGRRAIFAAFGLGKSVMQLEILRLILARQGGAALIVCPLGVRQEFVRDAAMLGQQVTFIRTAAEMHGDERHIAPLQLGFIDRCIRLWSNPGELVLTPFAGIGSEVYVARKLGRRGIGIELKASYWRTAVENLRRLDAELAVPSLFDEVAS